MYVISAAAWATTHAPPQCLVWCVLQCELLGDKTQCFCFQHHMLSYDVNVTIGHFSYTNGAKQLQVCVNYLKLRQECQLLHANMQHSPNVIQLLAGCYMQSDKNAGEQAQSCGCRPS